MNQLLVTSVLLLLLHSMPVMASTSSEIFTEKDRSWWAIQPIRDPELQKVSLEAKPESPIDHFILSKIHEAGLTPAPQAGPQELVRRVYLDLHGLPPTPEQSERFKEAFHNDPDTAWKKLVDELLEHRRYGERWASHWLDVVRYAESDGYRADDYRPNVYLYRDYVINSLNADKPYDQFVKEQLAADEFAYDQPDKLIATAFLRHGVYEWNQRNARMQWDIMLSEMTNVTGEVFLGLGIGCARCHDHKFDPLLQRDYYGLQAFLSSVWWPENRKLGTAEELTALKEWNKRNSELQAELAGIELEAQKGKIANTVKQFPDDIQAIYHKPSSERTTNEEQLAQLVERQVNNQRNKFKIDNAFKNKPERLNRYKELKKQIEEQKKERPDLKNAFITIDVGPNPASTAYQTRSGLKEVLPSFPALLGLPTPKIIPTNSSTGRRTALARWITSNDNPLTPRVIVNRIWQHHFGTGIVPTPNDFGTLGEPPSHPELLDWLASRFIDGEWKLKEIHRLILNSKTYRQTARREPSAVENLHDPSNRLLWRFPPQRLSAEQIRDSMLAVSGELREMNGGPSVDGNQPIRSIYVKKRRNSPNNILRCFDAPTGFDSAPNRPKTTTPTQALLLINNEWPIHRARKVADRILAKKPHNPSETAILAFSHILGRKPSNDELSTVTEFLSQKINDLPVTDKPKATHKFPNENGLRPIEQHFSKVKELGLGKHALWLQPGSRFEQLHSPQTKLESDSFTIEAVTILDSIHKDASVNTLASRWNGNQSRSGWTFGVTSVKSRYQPRNFILQLIGQNTGGSTIYEPIASNLRIPTGKPVYLAASIQTRVNGKSTATFYYADLSESKSELQSSTVSFQIAHGLQNPSTKLLLGGRDQRGHLWDGQLARLLITPRALKKEELLFSVPVEEPTRTLDLKFNQPVDANNLPLPNTEWVRQTTPQQEPLSREQTTLTDLCHVLLTSNEFLYLH